MIFIFIVLLSLLAIVLRALASTVKVTNLVLSKGLKNKSGLAEADFAKKIISSSLKGFSRTLRFSAFVVSRIRDLLTIAGSLFLIVEIFVIILIAIVGGSFLSIFSSKGKGGEILWNEKAIVELEADNGGRGLSEIKVSDDLSKPEGVLSTSWNGSDDVGKSIVKYVVNLIEESSFDNNYIAVGGINANYLICGVLEGSLCRTFNGDSVVKSFDFSNSDSRIQSLFTVSDMKIIAKRYYSIVNTNEILGGDIVIVENDVYIYIGKNDLGVDVFATVSNSCSSSTLLNGDKVKIGYCNIILGKDSTIIRTSKLID